MVPRRGDRSWGDFIECPVGIENSHHPGTASSDDEIHLDHGGGAVTLACLQRHRLPQSARVCERTLFCESDRAENPERQQSWTSRKWKSASGRKGFSEIGRSQRGGKRMATAYLGFARGGRRGLGSPGLSKIDCFPIL